ncbi:MAG: hypothetical protein ACI906_003572 [Candidatus Latescibacterota bacterium]|jgi:hypothetical protein
MQHFIRNGHITLQTQLPAELHQGIHGQIEKLFAREGNPSNDILPKVPDLYKVLEGPTVRGALSSLLGPEYIVHPHRHCHLSPGGSKGQGMHQDSYENDQNVRHHRCRWAMAFYYPHDVSLHNGPSAAIPTSQHYNSAPEALQRTELPLVGPAGTFTIVHYDLWHRAMPNHSDNDRFMVKFLFARLREPQTPTWDHENSVWQETTDDGPPNALCRSTWRWLGGAGTTEQGHNGASLEPLAKNLHAPRERERLTAAYALATHGDDGVSLLVKALRTEAIAQAEHNLERDHTNPSQLNTVLALAAAGPAALQPALALLSAPEWPLRAAAAAVLGDMGNQAIEAIPQLQRALTDDDQWVRRNAVEALGNMGPSAAEAVPSLCENLRDSCELVRHNTALTLAKIGPAAAQAEPALKEALADENLYVRENARIALNHIAA